jgi:hypothetical protein
MHNKRKHIRKYLLFILLEDKMELLNLFSSKIKKMNLLLSVFSSSASDLPTAVSFFLFAIIGESFQHRISTIQKVFNMNLKSIFSLNSFPPSYFNKMHQDKKKKN